MDDFTLGLTPFALGQFVAGPRISLHVIMVALASVDFLLQALQRTDQMREALAIRVDEELALPISNERESVFRFRHGFSA